MAKKKKTTKRKRRGLYGTGLGETRWYRMRDAVLDASCDISTGYDDLPGNLKQHPIAVHLHDYLYNKRKKSLDKAALLLAGITDESKMSISNLWLWIEKS